MKRFWHSILRYMPIISILLIGAYLRLYKISEYLTFLGDEGRDVLVVKRMIVDGKWTLLGPTASVGGFFMGPIYYYFMLPFLWLWKLDPVGPAIMVALFGIVTIYCIYRIGERMFGNHVGLVASSLYALSPIVISFSRSSWNPNIVPFFSTLLFYLCWYIIEKKAYKQLFWVGLILGIGIQLHYTFLFLFAAVFLWFLWKGRDRKAIPGYAVAVFGFIVGFSPFLAFEFRHGFTNTKAILEFVFAGKDTGFSLMHFIGNFGDVLFRLFGRLVIRIPDVGMRANLTVFQRTIWVIGSWVLGIASLVAGMRTLMSEKMDTDKKHALQLAFLWIVTILCFFGVYKKPIYEYYFGICFALPFFFTGILLGRIEKCGIMGKIGAAACFVFLILLNYAGQPFQYQANNQLGQTKLIAQAVLDHTDGKPYNFALITGGNSDHAYRYFLELWGRSPVTIENDAVDPGRSTVTDQLLIVCEYPSCQPIGNSLWEVAGFGRAEIAGVWDVSVVKVYKLIHYKGQ